MQRLTIRSAVVFCVLLTTLAAMGLWAPAGAAESALGSLTEFAEEGYSDHRPWIRGEVSAKSGRSQSSLGPNAPVHRAAGTGERFVRLGVQKKFALLDDGRSLTATIERLEKLLGPGHVQAELLRIDQIERAVHEKQYDFFILDAGWYARLETTDRLSAVASYFPMQAVDPLYAVGATFVTRADDESIQRIPDFVGKRIASNSPDSFTGYQIGLREMYKQGVILETLNNHVIFYGSNPRMVLRAVLDGNADIGMLATCEFEKLTVSDGFDPKAFRIVGSPAKPLMHCAHSTRLYPSYFFAGHAETGFGLRKLIAAQLLTMDPQTEKVDWTVRVSSRPVHELLFDLKAGPYADLSAWRLSKFAREQTLTVSLFLIVSLLIV
ncbi:MAG: phosphate/phosphite/phosphonate ABC transporter substrate-binding protein, partial [Duodenibacillus sp.]